MSGAALERVFREASGRIVGALAARFRNLALAEDAFSEACARALQVWPIKEVPTDPAAWLYQVAVRATLDSLRRQRTRDQFAFDTCLQFGAEDVPDDGDAIPDERLRLIFICCHPAVSVDSRAALTLRLVCGLPTLEIARAFLVSETTMAQRLTRAKAKIADAGVPFELPDVECWPDRLDAVLSTIEIAYAKAHEDAAASGLYAHFAAEMLGLTQTLVQLMPGEAEAAALAALIRFAEARRPARLDEQGLMVPLSEQDPSRWLRHLIDEANAYLNFAMAIDATPVRVIQARIHAAWCSRADLGQSAPWRAVLALYDQLLLQQDDVVIRLNRIVAVAEVQGVDIALAEVESLDAAPLRDFVPFHALRADLLRRAGRATESRDAYDAAIARITSPAEREWLARQKNQLGKR